MWHWWAVGDMVLTWPWSQIVWLLIITRLCYYLVGNLNIGSVNNNNVSTVLMYSLFSDFRNKTKCPVNVDTKHRVFISSRQQKQTVLMSPTSIYSIYPHLSVSFIFVAGCSWCVDAFYLPWKTTTGEIDCFLIDCGLGDWTDLVSISNIFDRYSTSTDSWGDWLLLDQTYRNRME